jgi:glutaredoxin 3
MLELWQTEWCPASRRIRERLTELGVDYLIRQVPVERADRKLLREQTGSDTIPVLLTPDTGPIVGEDPITAYLDTHLSVPTEARAHQLKADKARRLYLEEHCECSQAITH